MTAAVAAKTAPIEGATPPGDSRDIGSIAEMEAPEKKKVLRAQREQEDRGRDERWRETRWREDRRAVDEEDATTRLPLVFSQRVAFPTAVKKHFHQGSLFTFR